MRRFLSAFFGILIVAWVTPTLAQDSAAEKLQTWEAALTNIEQELVANPELPADRYREILRTVQALVAEANGLRTAAEQQQTAPLRAQLNQLGAAPAEGAPPEDPDIAAARARLSDEIGKSQARVKRAELVITRVQAIENDIGRREQQITQRKLAVQGPMPWSIATWQAALSEDDVIYKKIQPSAVQWWRNLQIAKMGWVAIAIGVGIVILAGILAFPVRRWVLAKWGPRPEMDAPSYGHRIIAAVASTIALILLPTLAVAALYIVFVVTLPPDFDSAFPIFVWASVGSLALFFVVSGLAVASLSPELPAWRIVPVPMKAAAKLGHKVVTGAGLLLLVSIAANAVSSPTTLQPSENFVSILALVASIITVGVFLPCLRAKYWISDTHFRSRLSWIVRTLSGLIMVGALVAALAGFSSLAGDLLSALFRSALLIGGALLLREVIGEGIRAFMTPGRRFYDTLSRTTGLSPETGRRLTFWVRFAADVVLWPPVIYGVLLACKISPTLLNAWLVRFFTQIQLGDINLSLVDVAIAILTVVLGLLVVGGLKRWVRERVMPNTQLDLGMQNSISTGVGYVGGLIVIMIAIMVLGIDFSSIALVAGALSVGIGFGLRTVVENFVAGLLLLIERPIKTGDWIVVSGTEGIVKSISVRSTEIETFDRASVIVPNSALIASPVTNWTHKNRIARVIVKLSVVPSGDARQIERILLGCAGEAEHVMKHPAPSVIFRAIGEEKLDFELRCFVADTDYYLPTLSALNFAIDAAMRRGQIQAVGGTPTISLQPALEEFARRSAEPA